MYMISRAILYYLVIVTLLGGALEIGYILGQKKPEIKPNADYSIKDNHRQTIPIGNERIYDWIEKINDFPISSLWQSDWTTSINGEFISLDENSITIKLGPTTKKLVFPISIKSIPTLKFSQYDKAKERYYPNSIRITDLKSGDEINVNTTVDTMGGEIKTLEIVRLINKKTF